MEPPTKSGLRNTIPENKSTVESLSRIARPTPVTTSISSISSKGSRDRANRCRCANLTQLPRPIPSGWLLGIGFVQVGRRCRLAKLADIRRAQIHPRLAFPGHGGPFRQRPQCDRPARLVPGQVSTAEGRTTRTGCRRTHPPTLAGHEPSIARRSHAPRGRGLQVVPGAVRPQPSQDARPPSAPAPQ
jgi:hypothetical protein